MTRIIIVFLGVSCCSLKAQQAPDEASVLAEIRGTYRTYGLPIYSLSDLENLPADKALIVYQSIAGLDRPAYKYREEIVGLVRKASIHIANRTDVGEILQKQLEAIPNRDDSSNERAYLYRYLRTIPAGWAARIMARDLMSEEPYDASTPFVDVIPAGSMQKMAIRGFEAMGLPGIPDTKGRRINDAEIQTWRNWWKANEPYIDNLVRQINPQYSPRSLPASTPAPQPTPPATPQATVIPLVTPPSTPSPTPQSEVEPVEEQEAPALAIYLVGAIFVIGVLGAAAWALRKPR